MCVCVCVCVCAYAYNVRVHTIYLLHVHMQTIYIQYIQTFAEIEKEKADYKWTLPKVITLDDEFGLIEPLPDKVIKCTYVRVCVFV